MNKKLISLVFLLGALAGLGVSMIFDSTRQPVETGPVVEKSGKQSGESNALLARIREQEQEIVRLKKQLSETAPPVVEEVPEPEIVLEPEPEPEPRSNFARRMDERMQRRVDGFVADYGLNDAQRSQLEEIFQKRRDNFRARRSGETVEPFNMDEALASVLSEEQFSQYLEDSQEEIYDRAELIATTQLVRLDQAVELSEDQQGLVYDAVHATAQEWMIARQTGDEFEMRQALEERLGGILTSQQMSDYLQVVDEGRRFGLPGGGPPTGP